MIPKRLLGRLLPALVLVLLLIFPLAGAAQGEQISVPIGGGYSEVSLQGYGQVVIDHALSPDEINIIVVPATYGTDPDAREDNLELAEQRTQQVEDGCNAVVDAASSCNAVLVPILTRDDAMMEENAAVFDDPDLDGIFMLGGDQTIAMEVLADTPSEEAMAAAFESGVVFGGSSAGAAVQSQTMLSGYVETGWPYNALEHDQIIIWWADDAPGEAPYMRGLSFGGERFFTDQHFYQRGRMTRSLNAVAQSDEHFDGESLIGLGFDYSTGAQITDDRYVSGVFGPSSVMVIDGESGNPDFQWTYPRGTLTAQNIVTHVLAEDPGLLYDMEERQVSVDGEPLPLPDRPAWDGPLAYEDGVLMLGGGLLDDPEGLALSEFLAQAGDGPILLAGVGYKNHGQTRKAAKEYREVLTDLGWTGRVDIVDYEPDIDIDNLLDDYAPGIGGVIFFAEDQSLLPAAIDSGLAEFVAALMDASPLILTDDAFTAAMGDWFVANPDPTDDNYQDESIAAFQSDYADVHQGLGIVEGVAFEPWLTLDQRWGRLYGLAKFAADEGESLIPVGISERTAIVLDADGASVVGERSVAVVDGRAGTFSDGENGAFTALNVYLDLYAEGSHLP